MAMDNALPAGVLAQVRGVAGTAGVVNANGRLYPRSVYEGTVERFNNRRPGEALLGELDHPDWPFTPRLERTAICVTGLYLSEAKNLGFTADVLNTPAGRTLYALLQAGVPINISTRGQGSLQPVAGDGQGESYHQVGADYELHGIDAVVRGAQPNAHITACGSAGTPQAIERRETMQNLTEDLRGHLVMEGQPPEPEISPCGVPLPEVTEGSFPDTLPPGFEPPPFPTTVQAQGTMIGHLEGQIAERDGRIGQLEAECADLQEAIRLHETGGEVARVVAGLRPDLRRTIEGQLSGCATPAEVRERWIAIESVLGAAGLLGEEPAGLGQSHLPEQPTPETYTPLQVIQRRLLAGG